MLAPLRKSSLRLIVEIEPDDVYSAKLKLTQKAKSDLARAILDYTESIRRNPDDAIAYHNRGTARRKTGDLDGSLRDFEEVVRLKPQNPRAYFNRGVARGEQRDLDKAIADYTEAIRLKPDYAFAYNNRGNARADRGDLDRALKDYEEAIRLQPHLADAYHNRGNVRAIKGDLDRAIKDYDEAIRLQPDFAKAYYNRGIAHGEKDDHDAVIADCTEAIHLNADYVFPYYLRGVAHREKGNHDQAIADFTEAIRLKPDHADAYYNRGISLQTKGELQEAKADFAQATQLNPELLEKIELLQSTVPTGYIDREQQSEVEQQEVPQEHVTKSALFAKRVTAYLRGHGPTPMLVVRISADLQKATRQLAENRGMTPTELVTAVLTQAVEEHEAPQEKVSTTAQYAAKRVTTYRRGQGPTPQLGVRINADLQRATRQLAEDRGMTLAELVTALLAQAVVEQNDPKQREKWTREQNRRFAHQAIARPKP